MISIEAYKEYLVKRGYKEIGENGTKSTVYAYAYYVEKISKKEDF